MGARATKLAEVSEAAVMVGVDVAKYSHWARVRGRELVKPVRFDNTRVGFSRLDQVVAEALHGLGLDKVIVGVEPLVAGGWQHVPQAYSGEVRGPGIYIHPGG